MADTNNGSAQEASTPPAFKLFVGNLPFSVTEEQLVSRFSDSGKVLNAVVVKRGNRSMGYAFLEFGSQGEVDEAAAKHHKQDMDGRTINVEAAQPRGPRPPRRPRRRDEEGGEESGERRPRPPRRRVPRQNNGEGAADASGEGEGNGSGARPRAPRQRRNEGGDNAESSGEQAPRRTGGPARRRRNDDEDNREEGDSRPPRRNYRREQGDRPPRREQTGEQGGEDGERRFRRRLPPRRRSRSNTEQEPLSKTMLFVANVAYAVDDDALAKAFEGISIKSAHVVYDRQNRSKGFAFIECDNEDEQRKAIEIMDQKEVSGRQIAVKPGRISSERSNQAAAGEQEKQ